MTLIYIVISIFAFGVLVFFHEFGHFIAAKLSGVKVEVFSIGWGKGIYQKQIGETTFKIGFIPFGGYCKMAGDDPNSELKGEPYEFYSQTPLKKIFISIAGVLMNIITAIIILFFVNLIPYKKPIIPPKIFIPEALYNLPAYKSGLRTGDKIISINNIKINDYQEMAKVISMSFGDKLKIRYLRNGIIHEVEILPKIDRNSGRAYIGVYQFLDPIIESVKKNSVFAKYGIGNGDRIIAVNNEKVICEVHFYLLLEKYNGEEVIIKIKKKDGKILNIKIFVLSNFDPGIRFKVKYVKVPGEKIPVAFINSLKSLPKITSDFFKSLKLLISKKVNVRKTVAGPVKIVYFSSEIAKTGARNFLEFFGLLSILLALTNLLPIPAVDGSYILFFTIELITRKELPKKLIAKIQTFGLYILFFLMVLVLINDIFTL